jgi:ribonuclease HII
MAVSERTQDELDLWASERGYKAVIGVDEAGRGPWAGPVVAAAVLLAPGASRARLVDSKRLSPEARGQIRPSLLAGCLAHSVVRASAARIDEINILRATLEAMKAAVLEVLAGFPAADCVLVDGVQEIPGLSLPCHPFPKADGRSRAVAAASILAKLSRDEELIALDGVYPGYGFARHKGYGTPEHQAALARLGPCPEHRRSFAPVKKLLAVSR